MIIDNYHYYRYNLHVLMPLLYPKMGMEQIAEEIRLGKRPGIPETHRYLIGSPATLDTLGIFERKRRIVAYLRFADYNPRLEPPECETMFRIVATQTKDRRTPPEVSVTACGQFPRQNDVG